MFGVPYPVFTRAPLVGSLDMDYWCSALWAFGTKGARVITGYGTPNMFQIIFSSFHRKNSFNDQNNFSAFATWNVALLRVLLKLNNFHKFFNNCPLNCGNFEVIHKSYIFLFFNICPMNCGNFEVTFKS